MQKWILSSVLPLTGLAAALTFMAGCTVKTNTENNSVTKDGLCTSSFVDDLNSLHRARKMYDYAKENMPTNSVFIETYRKSLHEQCLSFNATHPNRSCDALDVNTAKKRTFSSSEFDGPCRDASSPTSVSSVDPTPIQSTTSPAQVILPSPVGHPWNIPTWSEFSLSKARIGRNNDLFEKFVKTGDRKSLRDGVLFDTSFTDTQSGMACRVMDNPNPSYQVYRPQNFVIQNVLTSKIDENKDGNGERAIKLFRFGLRAESSYDGILEITILCRTSSESGLPNRDDLQHVFGDALEFIN